mmetsp:Transcript_25564/g.55003  ORF Transcript_25564/g.55003 Transcript_25564/m.55003 type:complete len:183 (-) Transcript_25564:1674-2222(-)
MTMTQTKTMMNRHQIARCILSTIMIGMVAAETAGGSREQSKPFYLRDIQVGDITLPFSPVTVAVMLISVVLAGGIFSSSPKSTATASHILLDGKDAEATLEKLKKEIKGDYTKFQESAKQHSKCPSGKSAGGALGTFKPGSMVPPFDKAIFGKENKVGEVIGPIQTNFGWHLIWIVERNLVE